MAGGFGSGRQPEGAVTPHRRTHVRFDVPDLFLIEQPYAQEREADDMCVGDLGVVKRCRLVEAVGWELESYQVQYFTTSERTEGQEGILRVGAGLAVAPGHEEVPMHRAASELSGATEGSSNLAPQGDWFIQKKIKPGDSWKQALDSDMAAMPAPTSLQFSETVKLDRVAHSTNPHDPNSPLLFRFHVPGNGTQIPHLFMRLYFNGPPTNTKRFVGDGYYCVELLGDGRAFVYQHGWFEGEGDASWDTEVATRFRWTDKVTGGTHAIYIRPYSVKAAPNSDSFIGGAIQFVVGIAEAVSPVLGAFKVGRKLLQARSRAPKTNSHVFQVRAQQPTPVLAKPVRIDARRDMRPMIQVSESFYPESGFVQDDPFVTEFPVSEKRDFVLAWWGEVPAGCRIEAEMFAADGTALQRTSDHSREKWATFRPIWGTQAYYAKFTLYSDSTRKKTPVLAGYRVIRDGVIEEVAPGEWTGGVVTGLSIVGPDADPTHESANIEIADPYNALPLLKTRGGIPCVIETEYNPNDPSQRAVLFRGYVQRADAKRRGTSGGMGFGGGGADKTFPSPFFTNYDIKLIGPWQRLSEAICARRFNWARDLSTGHAYKVTDVIRTCLTWAGFPHAMIDVPDLDILLFPPGGGDGSDLLIEPGADLGEFVVKLAEDYLGWWLTFDPSCGPYGMWRLLPPNQPPYRYLANFVTTPPQTAGKVAHSASAYEPTLLANGQTVPTTFIRKGTLNSYVNQPEANILTVSGVGTPFNGSAKQVLTQCVVNPFSFNFAGVAPGHPAYPDPTHPDFVGRCVPVEVFDPCLVNDTLINFMIRRIAPKVFHAQKVLSFEAPLLLLSPADTGDPKQTRPRMLRYYDAVKVDGGLTAIVRSCNPTFHKDSVQMAVYELVIPPPELAGV